MARPRGKHTEPKASAGKLASSQITTCKVCRYGVYTNQARRWATKPLGISHTSCLETPHA